MDSLKLRGLFLSTCLALLLPNAASSASRDNNVEWSGLFHDQSNVFISPTEPGSAAPVTVLFRSYHDDLTSVDLKYFVEDLDKFQFRSMQIDQSKSNAHFDYWKTTIPASASKKYYRFFVADGEVSAWYNAAGTSSAEPVSPDFYVIPDFKTPDWLKNGVIYQIFPDRFFDGDPSNNVVNGELRLEGQSCQTKQWGTSPARVGDQRQSLIFFGGDLDGIIQKSDYVTKTLGANIVYLTPIFKSPTNHKYDTTDYMVVDPNFGTDLTLQHLVDKLHSMTPPSYLILDGVFNHTGMSHPWFIGAHQAKENAFKNYYHFDHWPDVYQSFMGLGRMPKLNYDCGLLRSNIYLNKDSVAQHYLLPPFNADGWRLDAAMYVDGTGGNGSDNLNHMVWQEFRSCVKSVSPNAAILGEHWPKATPWTTGGEWDSSTNFNGFTNPVSQWINGKNYSGGSESLNTTEFDNKLRLTRSDYPTNVQQCLSNHLSNHDISRFAERADGDIGKTNLALFFQMTYVGAPTIYYGDEYGMTGGKDNDENRRCFDWTKASLANSGVALAQNLIHIRRQYSALRTGSFITLKCDDQNKIYCYGRFDDQNKIAVVLNNDAVSHIVEVPVTNLDISSESTFRDPLNQQTYTVINGSVSVSVPGHYGAILVKQ